MIGKLQTTFVRHLSILVSPVLLLYATEPSYSQSFPSRIINVIVPYPAGGTTDIAARAMMPFLEKYIGGKFIILNRGGAGGELGFREIAKSPPDGYTIGFINTPNVVTIPIERSSQYKLEDFATLANIVKDPCAIAVSNDSKFKTLWDVIAFAKANPGVVTYGTTGVGSDDHFAALEIERAYGIKLTHVPFPGGASVRQALLGGHIDLGIYNIGEMIGEIRQGQVRSLGIMADERWSEAIEVPTFREQGLSNLNISSERGLVAPAGIPEGIRGRYVAAIEKVFADPEFLAFAKQHPLPLSFMNPKEYSDMLFKMRLFYEKRWKENPWMQP